ncbi:hypothetical protein ACIMS1_003668 [Vibrio harveyi]
MPATRVLSKYISMYGPYIEVAFISSLLSYIAFVFTIWTIRKSNIQYISLPFGRDLVTIIAPFFILTLFVSYPKAMFVGDSRFGILGSLVVFAFSCLFLSKRNTKYSKALFIFSYVFAVFVFFRGERVDFVLMILLPFLYPRQVNLLKIFTVASLLFVVGLYSGLSRLGMSLNFEQLFEVVSYSITNFGTAVDVLHVYLSSFYYYYEFGSRFEPILNIVASYIPGMPQGGAGADYNVSILLREQIDNLGGGLFYSVGAISFGPLGVLALGFIYGILYKFFFKFQGPWGLVFIMFFVMQFRIQWYGFNYFGMPLLLGVITSSVILFLVRNRIFIKGSVGVKA